MIQIDFSDEGIAERIYRRIDSMTGPEPERALLTAFSEIDAISRELHNRVWDAVIAYAVAREEAALRLGVELATGPALWLLEPLPEPPTDEQVAQWKRQREERKRSAEQEQ